MRFAVVDVSMMSRLACAILRCFLYGPERTYLGRQNEHSTGMGNFKYVDMWCQSRLYCNVVWMLMCVGEMLMQGLRKHCSITRG